MRIHHPEPDALPAIQRFLSTLDLPHRDLTPSHLEHFLVCHEENKIVGVIGVELYGEVALLRSLAVRSTHRDRGLGGRLTENIEWYARQNGAEEIYLLTTTAADYFRQHGYKIVDRDALPNAIQETEEAAQMCPSSATCMRKNVGASAGNLL